MPSKTDHQRQAESNEAFYADVRGDLGSYQDWQVTSLFYAALHYVDAYLATKDVHPKLHKDRDWYVSSEAQLRHISIDYLTLKDRSMEARYDTVIFPTAFPEQKYDNEYSRIKNHIGPLL